MMKWLDDLFKHRIVQRYLQRLPKHLRKQHPENTGTYSQKQILDGIKTLKLADKYALYAIAALSDETTTKLYLQENQLNDDIASVRNEVADLYLNGNRDFTVEDVNTYAGISDTDEPDPGGD